MKKRMIIAMICAGCMLLNGCNKKIDYNLPDHPIVFEDTQEIDGYVSISYNNRTYIPYGTLSGSIDGDDVHECVGYYVQDNIDDDNCRICTLANDADNNFLMIYDTNGVLEQPSFYRAIDTKGKDIATPDFIDSSDYEYWQ